MADGKAREAWRHTACIMAVIANTARDPKKQRKAFTYRDFYPFSEPRAKPAQGDSVSIHALKGLVGSNGARIRRISD